MRFQSPSWQVDDPRNTDHAWIETIAAHYHCSRELGANIVLRGVEMTTQRPPAPARGITRMMSRMMSKRVVPERTTSTANQVQWMDVDETLQLFASHKQWVQQVAQHLQRGTAVDTIREVKLPTRDTVVRLLCRTTPSARRGAGAQGGDARGILAFQVGVPAHANERRRRQSRESRELNGGADSFRRGSGSGSGSGGINFGARIECESVDDVVEKLQRETRTHAPMDEDDQEKVRREVQRLLREAARNDFMRDSNQLTASRGEGLVALVSRWGRHDVTERVLEDGDFFEHRTPRLLQDALQDALLRVTDPSYDVRIVELLLMHGAKVSEVHLAALFSDPVVLGAADRFSVFQRIHDAQAKRDGQHGAARVRKSSAPLPAARGLDGGQTDSRRSSGAGSGGSGLVEPDEGGGASSWSSGTSPERAVRREGLDAGHVGGGRSVGGARSEATSSSLVGGGGSGGGGRGRPKSEVPLSDRAKRWNEKHDKTPWHYEHVTELELYVPGFERYARKQIICNAFDLVVWGICVGAHEFVKLMWERTVSPLRCALVCKHMCHLLKARASDSSNELAGLELWFEESALAIVEQLPDQEHARKLLLSAESDFAELGTPTSFKDGNILEVGVVLKNQRFIAHRYCQAVVGEMWLGRSPACGRVRLRNAPPVHRLLLHLLLPFAHVLDIEINDLFSWPAKIGDEGCGGVGGGRGGDGEVQVSLTRWGRAFGILYIPIVKRKLQSLMHLLFFLLFLVVAFQPLCAPMNATHLTLFGWVITNFLTSLVGFTTQWEYWSVNVYKKIEVATTVALLAFYVTAIALRGGHVFAPLRSTPIASDLIDYWDTLASGSLRAQHTLGRRDTLGGGGGGEGGGGLPQEELLQQLAALECGWTGWSEVLRTLLALAALTIAAQLLEVFSMDERLGALIVCAMRMGSEFFHWLPLVLTISFGTGVALNLLMPHFQSEHGPGAFRPFAPAELDLSASGPFWAPFWATFGYYHPGEVSGSPSSAFVAPALMWFYLLGVLVLFVNLLIAMFNEQYRTVMDNAREVQKMINVRDVMVYLVQYPIPAPFNVIALVFDFPFMLCRLLTRASRRTGKKGGGSQQSAASVTAAMIGDENSSSDGTLSYRSSRVGGSSAPDWLDPAMKKQMNTRQYLMERAANRVRPFQYDRSIVFTKAEASAVEKVRHEMRHEESRTRLNAFQFLPAVALLGRRLHPLPLSLPCHSRRHECVLHVCLCVCVCVCVCVWSCMGGSSWAQGARERHLQQRKAIEDRRRDELLHSQAFVMLQRRLDAIDARLESRPPAAPPPMPTSAPSQQQQRRHASSCAQSPAPIPKPRPAPKFQRTLPALQHAGPSSPHNPR